LLCIVTLATYSAYYIAQRNAAHRHALDVIAGLDDLIREVEAGKRSLEPQHRSPIRVSKEDADQDQWFYAYVPESDRQVILDRFRRLAYLQRHPEECGPQRYESQPTNIATQPLRPAESSSDDDAGEGR